MNIFFEKIIKFIRHNFKWIVFVSLIVVCFSIIEEVFEGNINRVDLYSYKYISMIISPKLTMFFKYITDLASFPMIMLFTVLGLLIFIDKKHARLIAINLVSVVIVNQLLKNLFNRPRPHEYRIVSESGYSFPSGHSMISMAFYGYIIYLVWNNISNKYIKYAFTIILSLLILLIGISRIYLGVHYATDVVGGFCISLSYLIFYTNITKDGKKENL